ncbi:LytR/AlgR family response regulator transcription factor [Moheibacter sediminis]|uniref:Two component transcriptional regulator, LytTR family n=1 Tax=Moheibacter sediminis TaxID=1434700 RepID=A0A1W2AQ36_9FLAO|nr:response regulator transcription factor [Moheibacter sediminis]SMC62839.1 two component transcriptional regulator, LytTR family [Moheibacter sediminis]
MEQKIILLVEDDFLNRRVSRKTLMENNYKVLEAKNAKEALEILKKEIIDLAILDINLGENEQDGITLAKQIKEKFIIPFIYLTAYENLEIIDKAVATAPYSYLTKPFKNVDLITSVEIAIKQYGKKYIPKILVKDGDYNVMLSIDEINYIESDGNYLVFHTDKKTYKSRSTIKHILEELSDSTFIQVHRAYVVNKTKIEKFNLKSLIIKNTEIPISRNYLEHIIA